MANLNSTQVNGSLKVTDKIYGSTDASTITSGTLPIERGGTGATTKKAAEYAINGGMPEATATLTENYAVAFVRVNDQSATNGVFLYRTMGTILNWIKTKILFRGAQFTSGNANYNYQGTYGSAAGSGQSDPNLCVGNGVYYVGSATNMPSGALGWHTSNDVRDGGLYAQAYSDTWVGQIAQDYRTGILCIRSHNSSSGTWTPWQRVVSSANFIQQYNSSTQSIDFTFV